MSIGRLPVFVCGLALASSGVAAAQPYPNRPVRLLVPTSPGGATDVVARLLAPPLTDALGKQFVVDNRAGASGIIGTDIAARAAPDGYTVMVVFDSFVTTPYVFKSVPYDHQKDFAPITLLVRGPQLFVVHPKVGVKTFGDFLALARSKPTPVVFATASPASSSRFSTELLKSLAKIQANLVHYKGGGPAVTELLGGHVEAMIVSASLVLAHAKAGRLTALGVSSKSRSAVAPGVPPIADFVPGFEAQSWVAMFAPAATPRDIVRRLNAEVGKAFASAEVKERLLQLGFESATGTPEELAGWVRDETAKWSKVIREQGITAE
jgi:tripartite-type tricarboxylate transporter receptor subunit TctC